MLFMIFSVDSNLGSSSPSPPNSSSSLCVAAPSSSTTTTSTYANSTWGAGSGSQSSSQGCGKVFVDGTDLEDWPTIIGGAKVSSDGAGGGVQDCPGNNNSSASWSEISIQQKGGAGNMDNPSPPRSSPLSSTSSLNECVQSSGGGGGSGVWVSPTSSQVDAGLGLAAFYNSKVSHLLPSPQESPVGGSSSSVPGANFNPDMNPSAWPALVQSGTSTSAGDSAPLHSSVTSSSSCSANTTLITTHTFSSVNQTDLYQQHTETAAGARSGEQQQQHLGNPGQELGSGGAAREAGPNQEGGSEGDCGAASEGEGSSNLSGSTSSSSASSSWRSIPPVSTDLSAGASQADGWGGGGTGAQGQEGNVWGSGTPGNKTGWGRRNGGGSTTPVVSQGPWEGSSSDAEWGETAGSASSSNLAIASGRGEEGSSISSSAGSLGVVGSSLEDSSSPKFATMTKAWDNQKGIDTGDGAVMEWGGGTGGEGPSSSGGGSIAGSGGGGSGSEQKQEHSSSGHHHSHQTSNAEVALLSLLNRPDLDPKVLSNTGWGQTQIRQNVAWDLDTSSGVGNRNERNTSSSSAFSSATMNTTTTRSPRYPSNTGSVTNDTSGGSHATSLNSTVRDGWDGGAAQSTCGPHMPSSTIRKLGSPEEDLEGSQGKAAGGWGDLPPESQGKTWGAEEQQWGDQRGGNWRDIGEQGSGWKDGPENKGTGGWKGGGRGETSGWGGGDWRQRDSTPGGGWGDGRSRGGSNSDEGSSWGASDEGGSQRGGWGDGGGVKSHPDWGSTKPHTAAAQIPNSQATPMKAPNQQQHQSQGQQPPGGPIQGGWNSRPNVGGGGPPSKNQNQSSGWTSGPIPQISGGGSSDTLEPSGWEEPSPQSISRKMEIDDGTSAWGDPNRYNTKNVNLWDKNSAIPGQSHSQQAPPPSMQQQQPPRRQQGMQSSSTTPGNGAMGKKKLLFQCQPC